MLVVITFTGNKRFGLADIYRGECRRMTVDRNEEASGIFITTIHGTSFLGLSIMLVCETLSHNFTVTRNIGRICFNFTLIPACFKNKFCSC
jgi:hypothetical protein